MTTVLSLLRLIPSLEASEIKNVFCIYRIHRETEKKNSSRGTQNPLVEHAEKGYGC